MSKNFEGTFSAIPTPFSNGQVDEGSLTKFVEFQIREGIDGLVVNGTTGESPTLHWEEVEKIFKIVRNIAGERFPLLVGTGSYSTEKTIESSAKAENMGADGLLIVTPFYNKPPQRGLVAHYNAVARAVGIPIVLYNVPGRTAVSLSAESVAELSRTPNIVGIKEATGDLDLGKKIIASVGESFFVSSGDDLTYLDLALLGGRGVISVLSNIAPKETKRLLDQAKKGVTSAREEFESLRKLTSLLFVEANPIPVKMALHFMGLFETPEMRLPLVALENKYQQSLKEELRSLGFLK